MAASFVTPKMKKFDSGKRKTDHNGNDDHDATVRIKRPRSDPSADEKAPAASSSSSSSSATAVAVTAFAASAASTPVSVSASSSSSTSRVMRSPYERWLPTDAEELKNFHKIISDIQTTNEFPVEEVRAYLKLPFQIVYPGSASQASNLNQIGCFIECLLQTKLSGIAGIPSIVMEYLSLHEIGLGILRDRGMEAPSRLFYFFLSIAHFERHWIAAKSIPRCDRIHTKAVLKHMADDASLVSEDGGLLCITDDTWRTVQKQVRRASRSNHEIHEIMNEHVKWIEHFEPKIRAGNCLERDIVVDVIPGLLQEGFSDYDYRLPMIRLLCNSRICGTATIDSPSEFQETIASLLYDLADKNAFLYWWDYLCLDRDGFAVTDLVFGRILKEYEYYREGLCKRFKMRYRLLKFMKTKITVTQSFIDVLNEVGIRRVGKDDHDTIADAEDKEYGCDDSDWDEDRDSKEVAEDLALGLLDDDDDNTDEYDDDIDRDDLCNNCFHDECDGTCQ